MRGKITKRSVDALKATRRRRSGVVGYRAEGLWRPRAAGRRQELRAALPRRQRPGRAAAQADDRPARLALDTGDGAQARPSGCSA